MDTLPDPNDYGDDPDVKAAKKAVREEKAAIEEMRSRLQEKRKKVSELKEDLSEVKADARIGDATESDVEEARQQLISTEEEANALQAEIETSQRAVEKLEDKARGKEAQVKAEIEDALRGEYRSRLATAIAKLEEAQKAVKAAAEVGSKLRNRAMTSVASMNGNAQSLVEGKLDHESMEVGVLTNRGNVRYTAEDLKAKAAKAGIRP